MGAADFPSQKAFFLHTIDMAVTRCRWDELCYDPPLAETYLRNYREIVDRFDLQTDSGPSENWAWPLPGDEGNHVSYTRSPLLGLWTLSCLRRLWNRCCGRLGGAEVGP
jgi:hypothetical protein